METIRLASAPSAPASKGRPRSPGGCVIARPKEGVTPPASALTLEGQLTDQKCNQPLARYRRTRVAASVDDPTGCGPEHHGRSSRSEIEWSGSGTARGEDPRQQGQVSGRIGTGARAGLARGGGPDPKEPSHGPHHDRRLTPQTDCHLTDGQADSRCRAPWKRLREASAAAYSGPETMTQSRRNEPECEWPAQAAWAP